MSDSGEVYDATAEEIDECDGDQAETPAAASATNLALVPQQQQPYTNKQLDLIKQTVAHGTSDLEFDLFVEVCHLTGLNPFAHQIYAIMRNASEKGPDGKWHTVKRMTIQTGIDGYLAIASRTGAFAGMDDVAFDTEEGDHPTWARVTVYRLVQGQRMPFTATARWREYVQLKDEYEGGQKTGKKTPTDMWQRMPWTMLGKCVRALALRLAFPAELSGVYTADEMMQADTPGDDASTSAPAAAPTSSQATATTRSVAPQSAPKPAPKTAPTAKRPAAPPAADAANDLITTDGCNPLADTALRKRMSALNIRFVADVETFLGRVKRQYTVYTKRAIEDELTAMEARAASTSTGETPSLEGLAFAGAN